MKAPGVTIQTLVNPIEYSQQQIDEACDIAKQLNRGTLVLLEPPKP